MDHGVKDRRRLAQSSWMGMSYKDDKVILGLGLQLK